MQRAIELLRSKSEQERARVDEMLAESGWLRTAESCVYRCQDTALKLKPWMTPPCWLRTARDVKAALREPLPDAHGKRANWWSGCWRPD
jgi:hypothetical protein